MPHVNIKTTSEKGPFGSTITRPTMNGLGKTIREKSYLKIRKNSKNPSEIAAWEQKTIS